MPEAVVQLAERMFVGPLWPASILVCLLVVYTIIALIGLVDLGWDAPEIDLDVDADAAVSVDADFLHGIGAATLRWTNFGRVPIVIWGGLFAVAFWSLSYGLWHYFDVHRYQPTWLPSIWLTVRNFVIATGVTKLLTQPLLGYFIPPPSYQAQRLLGATCEISTSQATPKFGQAKFRTHASPLLLNVRTDGPHLAKGTEVRIVGYDKQTRIYTVTSLPTEPQS